MRFPHIYSELPSWGCRTTFPSWKNTTFPWWWFVWRCFPLPLRVVQWTFALPLTVIVIFWILTCLESSKRISPETTSPLWNTPVGLGETKFTEKVLNVSPNMLFTAATGASFQLQAASPWIPPFEHFLETSLLFTLTVSARSRHFLTLLNSPCDVWKWSLARIGVRKTKNEKRRRNQEHKKPRPTRASSLN